MPSSRRYPPLYSCEFFPPASDDAAARLNATRAALEEVNPAFFSVTYGAGGTTRKRTFAAVEEINARGQTPVAPHLTCIGASRNSIRTTLEHYRRAGIRRIVALRGDMPSGAFDPGELRYASDLVAWIRETTGDHFHIEVAAYPEVHPQARSTRTDLEAFRRKVEAGANGAITQYFYNADAYFRFVDDCEALGLDIPIVPGIMPITNYHQLARFSDACGTELPRWLRRRLQEFGEDRESLAAFGLDVVCEMSRRLLEGGAPGLHFYTMNRSGPTLALWQRLGLAH